MNKISNPQEIEATSFKIIDKLIKDMTFSEKEKNIVRRVIHATVNIDYAKELLFHPEAIESGLKAIRAGKNIIVDVNMVKVGINEKILKNFGGKIICLINDMEVIESASNLKISKAAMSMRKASKFMDESIITIGNAPTALFEVIDLIRANIIKPALVVGIPVGFVGAAESKQELLEAGIPYITNSGNKGGSSVAVAITNALLKMA
ncbi:precorrin-8X methylmutase [Candidatus Poribacteria bacterium]|nr:precorrin-8X methylmutase [Candidatus Poribacteria bacterium]